MCLNRVDIHNDFDVLSVTAVTARQKTPITVNPGTIRVASPQVVTLPQQRPMVWTISVDIVLKFILEIITYNITNVNLHLIMVIFTTLWNYVFKNLSLYDCKKLYVQWNFFFNVRVEIKCQESRPWPPQLLPHRKSQAPPPPHPPPPSRWWPLP